MPRVSNPCWYAVTVVATTVVALAPPRLGHAQDRGAPSSGLFASEEPLTFTLELPYSDVLGNRNHPEYSDAKLAYKDGSGRDVTLDLRIRVRGKSRAQACSFPPLLLNFPAKALDGTWFDGENKLKLVTHCSPSASYDRYQAVEYAAYRAFNQLTDMSLRVRPVEITYYDSKKGRVVITKPGFLLEDEERFAERHGLRLVTDEHIDRNRYDPAALALVDMFQYFLGNTDWSALEGPKGEPCCHNVVPMARADGTLVPIPYDFDSTGIVNPPYALPAVGLPIRDVRTRLYRGTCRDAAELKASYEPFRRHRNEILAQFDRQQARLGKALDVVHNYIDDFYDTLADPDRAQKVFRVNCAR